MDKTFEITRMQDVGGFGLGDSNEHSVTIRKVDFTGATPTPAELREALADRHIKPTPSRGPGTWYLSHVDIGHISTSYRYAIVEIHGMLDV